MVQRSCPLSCQQTLKQLAVGDMAAQNRSYSFHIVSHRFRIQHAYACLACPETGQARCETFLVSSTLACWLSVNSKVTTSPGSWPWKDYGRYGRTRDFHRFGQAVDICRLRYDSLASVFGHSFVQKLQDLKCRSQGANGANKKNRHGAWPSDMPDIRRFRRYFMVGCGALGCECLGFTHFTNFHNDLRMI